MRFRQNLIKEGFEAKIKDKGQIPFSETKLTDPHVKKLLDHVSKMTGKPVSELEDKIKATEAKYQDVAKKAPLLYSTIAKNVIESEVFHLIEDLDEDKHRFPGAPKFNPAIFLKLVKRIKAEHDQFFPLRNFIDHKYLKNERIVLIPSDKPENKHLNSVDTAAATKKGEFAFNKKFMQKLIEFAYVKGVKGTGKKWMSNGGDIPDEYVYIEFLIIHEFMHFTYADFHYHKIYKVSNKIINWVGDFRTNYLLVKSGYHQLPMGLFSDDINYDRQKSYKEMIDVVRREFEKLKPEDQKEVESALNGSSDDHSNPVPDDSADDDDDAQPTEADVDAKHREIEKKVGERGDKSADDVKPSESKDGSAGSGKGSPSLGGANGSQKFDYSKVKPKFSWTELLKKLLSSVEVVTDETYQRPSRSSIRNIHLARQTGAGAVKPGEIQMENPKNVKICFVVDSSGSMTSSIAKVYANIDNLLKKNRSALNSDFFLIKFSSSHEIYKCNIGGSAYIKLDSVDDKKDRGKPTKGNLKSLFTEHFGAGTVFGGSLVEDLEKLNRKGYNLILITDDDILFGSNLTNFFKLYGKTKKNLFVLADSKDTYHRMLEAMKQIAQNITYIED